MHKYIEELICGDAFLVDNEHYVLTRDFKKNGSKLAIGLKDGISRWFESDKMVENSQLYIMDRDNNIIPIKPTAKQDVSIET